MTYKNLLMNSIQIRSTKHESHLLQTTPNTYGPLICIFVYLNRNVFITEEVSRVLRNNNLYLDLNDN